jgi:hypothetical protein
VQVFFVKEASKSLLARFLLKQQEYPSICESSMSSFVSPCQSIHPGKKSAIAFAALMTLVCASEAFANTGTPAATVISQSASGSFKTSAIGDAYAAGTFNPITSGTLAESNNLFGSGNSYAYSSIYAETTGSNYGSAAFAAGLADAQNILHKEFTFHINTAGIYSLDTLLNSGYAGTNRSFYAGGTGEASFNWTLSVNGNILKSTSATVFQGFDYGTFSVTTGGNVALNSFNTLYGRASWDATTVFTDIGFQNANTDVTVAFDLTTSANANYEILPFYVPSYGSCFTVTNPVIGEGKINDCGSSSVSFSDPTFINGPGANQAFLGGIPTLTEISPVPEPAEWMMLLSGMALVTSIAKRRRARS